MLCYAILYYTILYYTILYYTILYYTILYYTISAAADEAESFPGLLQESGRAASVVLCYSVLCMYVYIYIYMYIEVWGL